MRERTTAGTSGGRAPGGRRPAWGARRGREPRNRTGRLAAIGAMLLVGASACGDLTAGGVGEVEVLVSPDSIAIQAASVGSWPARQTPQDVPSIEGTLQIRVQVFVLRPPGRWVQVTDGAQEVLLDLAEPAASTVARRSLAAGSYVAVRTVFYRVRADIERGLEVDGEPVTGEIDVDLGIADRLEVFRPLELTVSHGEITELGIDLHAARWLRRLDRDLRRVAAGDFENELGLRHRPRDFP